MHPLMEEKVMGQQIHPSVVDVDIVVIHTIDVNLKMLPADNVERKDICTAVSVLIFNSILYFHSDHNIYGA